MHAATKYKAILFDKDGTLIDLAGPWMSIFAELLKDLDPSRFEELAAVVGLDTAELRAMPFSPLAQGSFADLAEILAEHVPNLTAQEILDRLMQAANGSARKVRPLSGTVEAIKQLHSQGYLLGIISNDCVEGIQYAMQELGIAPYICYIAGSDSGYGAKPTAGMVTGFCLEYGIEPEQVVMVGDSPADMQTAEMGGCGFSVGIHFDAENPTLRHYTPHILADLSPLPALLQKLESE